MRGKVWRHTTTQRKNEYQGPAGLRHVGRGGTVDKWNNMVGACSAGCVANLGKGPGMMASGCMNFAAMSYILDLFVGNRNRDPFEAALRDPDSVEKDMMTKQKTNVKS